MGLAALKAGKSISKDETKSLVMSMGHRLTAVIVQLNNSVQSFISALCSTVPILMLTSMSGMNSESAVLFGGG